MDDQVKGRYFYLMLKENFYDSDDMILLESMENGYLYSNILLKLYLKSLKDKGKLMYKDRIPYNIEMLSKLTRHNVDIVRTSIQIFKEMGIIEVLDNGAIFMLDIENYIGKSSTEADRKRKYNRRIADEKNKIKEVDKCPDKCLDKSPAYLDLDIDLNLEEKKIDKKKRYGEFKNVLLTDDEYHKLEQSNLLSYIERLSSYIASKGKKYKSHYATILNWNRKDKPNKKSLEQIMKEIK